MRGRKVCVNQKMCQDALDRKSNKLKLKLGVPSGSSLFLEIVRLVLFWNKNHFPIFFI